MKGKKFRIGLPALGILILLLAIGFGIWAFKRLEGTEPVVELDPASFVIGKTGTVSGLVRDDQSGIRRIWIGILKDGRETVLIDKTLDGSVWQGKGHVARFPFEITVDTDSQHLSDGKGLMRISVRDFSWRRWWHGNRAYLEKEITIDTRAPSIRIRSTGHYLNQGGSGVVIYKLSEACKTHGVRVGDDYYPGHNYDKSNPLMMAAFYAVDYRRGKNTAIHAEAVDPAGNITRQGFRTAIRKRKFRRDIIRISDNFLNWKLPEFGSDIPLSVSNRNIDRFLYVNRTIRSDNYRRIRQVVATTADRRLWKGGFLRLPKSARKAGYAEHREYRYKKKSVDRQVHLGIDLASVKQSPVPASNNGRVVMAERLGIYGNTIIIDHGLGLFSLYSHLSQISIAVGADVGKGDIIGHTGDTGMAGGDHLHFSMLVNHTFVNPLEWWDAGWIRKTIDAKFDAVAALQ